MLSVYIPHNYALFTASLILPYHHDCDYHVCRGNKFTLEGEEQIKEAVSKRNSVGDMTELELSIYTPTV